MQLSRKLLILCVLLVALIPSVITQTNNNQTYTVRSGDTLFRIAQRFGTTTTELAELNGITNPRLIYSGQVLNIPSSSDNNNNEDISSTVTNTPEPITNSIIPDSDTPVSPETPEPTTTPTVSENEPESQTQQQTYRVQRGDTLFQIAVRNNTTVDAIVRANNLSNPSIIFTGQQLTLPSSNINTNATDSNREANEPPDEETVDIGAKFAYGIEIFPNNQSVTLLSEQLQDLGMDWVKINIDWSQIEPEQGQMDFTELDQIIAILTNNNFNILVTVSRAPIWASYEGADEIEYNAPTNVEDYGIFIGELAKRYSDQIDAYEIWNEPNLSREWNTANRTLQVSDYLELLTVAAIAIRANDDTSVIISGGLAPNGFHDGINALGDRIFLEELLQNNVTNIVDAIGAHPIGWANPPDARCCDQAEGVETHFDDPTFFFLDTLTDYRELMVEYGAENTPIWITRFGWGTAEDTLAEPDPFAPYLTYTDLSEQAQYLSRAFEIGQELGYVETMVLYNLNGCQINQETCFYALVSQLNGPRPAFASIQQTIQSNR